MKYKVVELKELTKEILEEMLAEAYEDGYRDGKESNFVLYRGAGDPVKTDWYYDSITATNQASAECGSRNVKTVNNALHSTSAYQNNTLTGYRPNTSVAGMTNISPPKGTEGQDA